MPLEFRMDVTEAAAVGEPAHVALTVHLPAPEAMPEIPIVCFAKPGGGYSRGYYTCDLPGPGGGASEADWHADRGWIVVSVDHLGVGDSSIHAPEKLGYTAVANASQAAEAEVLRRLAEGTLHDAFPSVRDPLKIGIGQSMGGCMTIVQQGRHHCYDGIGVLGYSAIHTHPPVRPGEEPIVAPWIPRDRLTSHPFPMVNEAAVRASMALAAGGNRMAWGFHYDDVPAEVVERDLAHFNRNIHDPTSMGGLEPPPWSSLTTPGAVAQSTLTPGAVAAEAAAVTVPVLCAMGERDVVADPPGEPRAFRSSRSVELFVCPRMGHMHNFAGTRELFWRRIELFAEWCRTLKQADATLPGLQVPRI